MPLIKYFGPSQPPDKDGFQFNTIYDVAHVSCVGEWVIDAIRKYDGELITNPAVLMHFEPAFVRAVRAPRGLTNGTIYEVHSTTSSDIRVHPDGFLFDRTRFEPVWDGPPAKPVTPPQRWRLLVVRATGAPDISTDFETKPDISVDPSGALVLRINDRVEYLAPGKWEHAACYNL